MIDPQVEPILNMLAGSPEPGAEPIGQARLSYDEMRGAGFAPVCDEVPVNDFTIEGASGPMKARVYPPPGNKNPGLFIQVHGGGFFAGSIGGYEMESRAFANLADCKVLTFEYALSPEHKFPLAINDTLAVLKWAFANASTLGWDPARIAIGGDSAGANLAAVAAIMARDIKLQLAHQVLIYPCTDYSTEYPSMREDAEFADISALPRKGVIWARDQYLRSRSDVTDWRASPLLTPDLTGVAPAFVVLGDCDVLRDEGVAYAKRLLAAGVETDTRIYSGLPHGFFSMGAFVDAARDAVEQTCATLKAALAVR